MKKKIKLQKKFYSMIENKHLINQKDYQEPNICHSLMCSMTKESFMVCQECGCMYIIEFDIKSGRRAEINNGKSKYPYKKEKLLHRTIRDNFK